MRSIRWAAMPAVWALIAAIPASCDSGDSGGSGSDSGGSSTGSEAVSLTYVDTHVMDAGTHRPEILTTSQGEIVLAVVEPEGAQGVGQVKHQAYRFDSDFNAIGSSFVLTQVDATYGEPADHRATLVNDELVVVYQSLNWIGGTPPTGGGPAESSATDQSLMLARFDLDGNELFRAPIVDRTTNFSQDSFPDHCLLWTGGNLLVSTGSMGALCKVREVDLDASVLSVSSFTTSNATAPGCIGNSLCYRNGGYAMLSASGPSGTAALSFSGLDGSFQPTLEHWYEDPGIERNFPTGCMVAGDLLLVAYIGRPRGGPIDMASNPYHPYLMVLNRNLEILIDQQVGTNGFSHVHPTVAMLGDRLFVAWSSQSAGSATTPQVRIEEFLLQTP